VGGPSTSHDDALEEMKPKGKHTHKGKVFKVKSRKKKVTPLWPK